MSTVTAQSNFMEDDVMTALEEDLMTARSQLSDADVKTLEELELITAESIPSDCSLLSDISKLKESDGSSYHSAVDGTESDNDNDNDALSLESYTEWDLESLKKDPPSVYHLPEMNTKPVKMITRMADTVPSQYHVAELQDYQALQANPYMLKLATSKCVVNRPH